ncbi:MAG: TSUP family transporter [Halovenus sp.]
MALSFTPAFVAALVLLVLVAGTVNGLAGFGFAVVGTMGLATVVAPAVAVAFMILPIFAVNVALVRELSVTELRTCGRRFAPLILAALAGTLLGMVLLDRVPAGPLRVALGLVALAFVASVQKLVDLPGLDRTKEACFVETPLAMAGVGGVSGLLFGGTNVGVQLVAYIRSCDLSHGLFVGVVAMVFLGLNGVRVGAAGVLGLYPDLATFAASLAAAVPAVVGVAVGSRLRERVGERLRRSLVLGLLTAIGIRLILGGLGIA